MGIPLNAPLTPHAVVYTLPMLTIKEEKGNLIIKPQYYCEALEHNDTISTKCCSQLQNNDQGTKQIFP